MQGLTVVDPTPGLWARWVHPGRLLVLLVLVVPVVLLARMVGSQVAGVAGVLLLLFMVLSYGNARVLHDERRLEKVFGVEYSVYRARVKRWIPFVL